MYPTLHKNDLSEIPVTVTHLEKRYTTIDLVLICFLCPLPKIPKLRYSICYEKKNPLKYTILCTGPNFRGKIRTDT